MSVCLKFQIVATGVLACCLWMGSDIALKVFKIVYYDISYNGRVICICIAVIERGLGNGLQIGQSNRS